MPFFDVYDFVIIPYHLPDALDDMVDADVLLQRIGPGEIVVPIIGDPPNETSTHVSPAGNGQERHRQVEVRRMRIFDKHDIVMMFRAFPPQLCEDVRRAQGFRSRGHLPLPSWSAIKESPHRKFRR